MLHPPNTPPNTTTQGARTHKILVDILSTKIKRENEKEKLEQLQLVKKQENKQQTWVFLSLTLQHSFQD